MARSIDRVIWLEDLGRQDVTRVGGKNAPLGEMIRNLVAKGVKVPPGFATTAGAYCKFIAASHLNEPISAALAWSLAGSDRKSDQGDLS